MRSFQGTYPDCHSEVFLPIGDIADGKMSTKEGHLTGMRSTQMTAMERGSSQPFAIRNVASLRQKILVFRWILKLEIFFNVVTSICGSLFLTTFYDLYFSTMHIKVSDMNTLVDSL